MTSNDHVHHLAVTRTSHGFDYMEATLHLTAENTWRLAEQLMVLVQDHYQGDARPDHRVADIRGGEATP